MKGIIKGNRNKLYVILIPQAISIHPSKYTQVVLHLLWNIIKVTLIEIYRSWRNF